MRLFALYLRTRRAGYALGSILLLAVVVGLSLAWSNRNHGVVTMLILTLVPATVAAIVGLSTATPFSELEQAASRPLAALRLSHLACLVLAAVLALAIASIVATPSDTWLVLLRNTIGYAGVALTAAMFLGPASSWWVPVLYSTIVFMAGSETLWAWPLRPPGNEAAATVAGGLLVVGLAFVARADQGFSLDSVEAGG